MKWNVNGEPIDLTVAPEIELQSLPDRLVVRTSEGVHSALSIRSGGKTLVSYRGRTYEVSKATRLAAGKSASDGSFAAPMPGVVVDVLTSAGANVVKGQKLLVLEAMKTQQPIVAPFDGTIETLSVQKGDQVIEGQPLVTVTANA
ncbi:MAG: biotin/lipoyl-binding protein [Chthonomonas sp.]|nr:biotin/lipoyl-binding protein [Chthonomonas sp.]